MPDAKVTQGLVDTKILNETLPSVFQFYRFGFVKVYREDSGLVGYYSHD
jgi:hypothetical protein